MSDIDFLEGLREVINRHSREMHSNTPDYVLAQFLHGCLFSFDRAMAAREQMFRLNPVPGVHTEPFKVTNCQTKQEPNDSQKEIKALWERLRARADNAYCDYINASRVDDALGMEIKLETGTFTQKNLQAHTNRADKLGRHRGLAEARDELYKLIKENGNV